MDNKVKELYRYNVYKDCRVLVNDMKDVISELKLFLNDIVYPYLLNEENHNKIIVDNISIENDDGDIRWSIVLTEPIDDVIFIDKDIVKDVLVVDDKYVEKVKEQYSDFPKELFAYSWISFMKTLSTIIFGDTIINEEINVFDICKLGNNGHNNVVFN